MSSDGESDLTDLSDLPPPNTPGHPLTPGRPAPSDEEVPSAAPITGAKGSSAKGRRTSSKKGQRRNTEREGPSEKPARSKAPAQQAQADSHNLESAGTATASAGPEDKAPRRSLKIKLSNRGPAKQASSHTPVVAEAKPSFDDSLKELADDDDDEQEDGAELPGLNSGRGRATRRSRVAIEEEEEDEEADQTQGQGQNVDATTATSKRKRLRGAGTAAGSSMKKRKQSAKTRPNAGDDFVAADDSDEEMVDAASEASNGESDASEEDAQKAKGKQRAPKRDKSRGGQSKSDAASVKQKAGDIKDASKGATGSSNKRPSQAELNKIVAAKIRASAAASTAAASGSAGTSSNPTTPATVGDSSAPSSMARKRPMGAKPRGSDMWGSLVGSSRPSPRPPPPKEEAAAKTDASLEEQKKREGDQQRADPNRSRQPQPGGPSNALPRPLGTGAPANGASSRGPSSMNTHNPLRGPGVGSRGGGMYARESTFVVHMTPGLNGQHWDKEAYRRMRIAEKQRYRNPSQSAGPGGSGPRLLNLLEDAELLAGFEDEWRSLRISNRVKYPSLKYREYGAGLEYAKMLKETRRTGTSSTPSAMTPTG
ncbi:unnamed protein product [Parajaminaea phylloscopi]